MDRLTDEQLRERKQWEGLAPNANATPDQEVLAMITEIQERRASGADLRVAKALLEKHGYTVLMRCSDCGRTEHEGGFCPARDEYYG